MASPRRSVFFIVLSFYDCCYITDVTVADTVKFIGGYAFNNCYNLKNINIKIPLGTFTCVTGVSGSGKSSFVNDILCNVLANKLNNAKTIPGKYKSIEGIENLDKIMDDFNKKGIDFSLDDYGTGYSNQSNLMRYPYSIVKIDKSLVWACDSNPKAFISLKHTIAMIKDLDMKVLAEGVETEEQKAMLCELGCDYFQGYYYSKPVPQYDFLTIIRNGKISGASVSL